MKITCVFGHICDGSQNHGKQVVYVTTSENKDKLLDSNNKIGGKWHLPSNQNKLH